MHRAKRAVEEWKVADEQARAAEARLKAAWDAYDAHQGPAPGADLMAEVSRLRPIANDKLTVAMILTNPDSKPTA
jgi:ferric-dicitrate binding protein FerR (iron transport regulator)